MITDTEILAKLKAWLNDEDGEDVPVHEVLDRIDALEGKTSAPMSGLPDEQFPEDEGTEGKWASRKPMSGLPDEDTARKIHDLRSAARGDPEDWHRQDMLPDPEPSEIARDEWESENMVNPMPNEYKAAHEFLSSLFGPDGYTPDSVGQLVEVFIPCLRIMTGRPYEPTGALWRRAGILGIIWDVRKKFERLWYRTWTEGNRHDDSGFDLINFTGFLLRSDPDSRFGDAGEPAPRQPQPKEPWI